MMRKPSSLLAGAVITVALNACNVFDNEIVAGDAAPPACLTNQECTDRASAGGETVPAVCVQKGTPRCVELLTEDCTTITGDYLDDNAVLIASLLSTTGAQAATNIPRQQAAIMAVEQINATNASNGILQSSAPGDTKKLVMLSCDEIADLPRVASHLVTDLSVTAVVGPNLSQDVLDLTTGDPERGLPSSAAAGVALFTPTGVASAIASIPDNGMTFMMVPSDIQRVELMIRRYKDVEAALRVARGRDVKLAIYYRDDALGQGTRDGLASSSTMTVNGDTLSFAISTNMARQDGYDPLSTDNTALVADYIAFRPDIVIVVGAGESIKYFVKQLEEAWDDLPPSVEPPYYIGIDSVKTPDLVTLVTGDDDLRLRWSGTGLTTSLESRSILSAFQIAYGSRWVDGEGNPQPATGSGLGPAYDAVYSIALGLVGKRSSASADLVEGLPRLSSNTEACTYDGPFLNAPCFSLADHSRTLYQNMGMLLDEDDVTEIGTAGRLEWDDQGAKATGIIEIWCIDATNPAQPIFATSGLTYDVSTRVTMGTFTQCGS
jgi:ABC-type branched-subunit amino acid transport system substrate-binding protein